MKKIKRVLAMILILSVSAMFAGCDLPIVGVFDAAGYIQSLLDAQYKGIFDQYIEFTQDTAENAEQFYNDNATGEAMYWASVYGMDAHMTEDTTARAGELFKQIYQNAKYDVTLSAKDGTTYLVKVVVTPIVTFAEHIEDFLAVDHEMDERYANGEFDSMSDEELYEYYMNCYIDVVENTIVPNISYGEPVEFIVQVPRAEDGSYYYQDSDFSNIDNYVILYQQ
ncbi:MAG TPA: hypothetical protein H9671_08160 [Firmicutes bacterium]|nr:hypothetical protein [Bacillota bacterium]